MAEKIRAARFGGVRDVLGSYPLRQSEGAVAWSRQRADVVFTSSSGGRQQYYRVDLVRR